MAADRPHPDWPVVVAYGLGVNSTAMLVEFVKRGVRPDLILFADTGGEKPETYAYLPVIQAYLKEVQFPPVVPVRYEPKTVPYRTLEGQCLHTGTLPSLAYGGKSCSIKWKRQPQDAYILWHFPPGGTAGRRVVRAIGFDAAEGRHPRLLGRALAVEANAKPNLSSVKGLGRSFAWGEFLAGFDRPPLFPNCP
jgi:hypothetical protein